MSNSTNNSHSSKPAHFKKTEHSPNIKSTKPTSKITNSGHENSQFPLWANIIIALFIGIFFIYPLAGSLVYLLTIPDDSHPIDIVLKYPFIVIITAILALCIALPIGAIIGKLRAKRKILQSRRQVQLTNPYQYYKELPNNFGIGVATLLANSTIENEKDITAALLDLCAQGYLRLSRHSDRYVIQILPPPARTPLSNEAYLLDLIHNNSLHKLDYHKWYQLCVNDGVSLGLFRPIKFPAPVKQRLTKSQRKITQAKAKKAEKIVQRCLIIYFILGFALIPLSAFLLPSEVVGTVVGIYIFSGVIVVITLLAIYLIVMAGLQFREASTNTYKSTLERHLQRTDKGVTELQKLLAFKQFLAQFNTFVDKNPEAVILWDHYLSYAQVFGLAQEIMNSGYNQLIDNAAFKIDDINHITKDNIQISANPTPSS